MNFKACPSYYSSVHVCEMIFDVFFINKRSGHKVCVTSLTLKHLVLLLTHTSSRLTLCVDSFLSAVLMSSETGLQDPFELMCQQPMCNPTLNDAAVTTVGNVKIFLSCVTILQASALRMKPINLYRSLCSPSSNTHSLVASGKPVRRE